MGGVALSFTKKIMGFPLFSFAMPKMARMPAFPAVACRMWEGTQRGQFVTAMTARATVLWR